MITVNLGYCLGRAELYEDTEMLLESALQVLDEYNKVMNWAKLEFPDIFK